MSPKKYWKVLQQAFTDWQSDKAPTLGAALAYYSVFSLPPLLIIVLGVSGLVFGREAVQGHLITEMQGLVGTQGAEAIQTMLASASKPTASIIATIAGVITLLIGASGVFGELQAALNAVWEVQPREGRGFWGAIKERFFSFAMVLALGFLFLVSLIASTVITALQVAMKDFIPGPDFVAGIANFLISVLIITSTITVLYKYLPDVKVAWNSAWQGAVVATVLFIIGKYAIGVYLGRTELSSTYGAASSVVILLLWIYYSAQIFLYGAEFSQAYTQATGRLPEVKKNAQKFVHPEPKLHYPEAKRAHDEAA